MKKLMIAAVAMAAGAVFADGEITSQNIVGYNTTGTEGAKYPSFGGSFVPVSGATTFKLKEIKPSAGSAFGKDKLQKLNPETTVTMAQYSYFSQTEADQAKVKQPSIDWDARVGWWDMSKGGAQFKDAARADDVDVNVGQGFLGNMKNDVDFQCAGSAPVVTTSISTDGAKYPFAACYIPRDITLKYIVPTGSGFGKDKLQVLNPENTVTLAQYSYFSQAEADQAKVKQPSIDWDARVGWWDMSKGGAQFKDAARADSVVVNPGDAFLGNMKNNVTFQFPSSTATLD